MTEQQGAAGIGSGKSSERNHGEKYRMGGSKAQVTGSGRGGRFGCRRRDATGEGQHLDLSLLDCQVAWLINEGTITVKVNFAEGTREVM